MKSKSILLSLIVLLFIQCSPKQTLEKPLVAKIDTVEDIYFGKTVSDQYRYMEDLQDSTVITWFKSQADYSRKILNSIPGRQSLIDKMQEFDERKSSSIYNLNITDDDRYFYLKITPEDETGKLYFRDGYEGVEEFLYDPLKFSDDSTKKYVINGLTPSNDGTKVAFGIASGGSESTITLVMNVDKKTLYPEQIDRCMSGSYSWLPDDSGYIYIREHSSNVHDIDRLIDTESLLHIIGTNPQKDRVVFSRPKYPNLGINPEDIPFVEYDKDSGLIFGYAYTVDRNLKVFYAQGTEINNDKISWKQLIDPQDEIHNFYTTDKDLYLYTPKNAPNFRVLKTSIDNPDVTDAEVVVSEDPHAVMTSFGITIDGLYYTLSNNGVQEKLYYLANGSEKPTELDLPFTAGSIVLKTKGVEFSDLWVGLSGWTSNYQRYKYISNQNEFKLENLSERPDFPEYKDLIAEEVMVESHDGTMVPISLVYLKGTKKDGKNPVLIFGYGAYGISMNPFFSPEFLQWTSEGGIFAIAHVRGGGELGNQWHKAGYKTTKPNTWKDLIACAEYLIGENYTSPNHLAIYSGSAGGILVGRAMTERPDLFAAVIPDVGCMNTLRGENSPNGPVNIPEFGTSQDSVECMALLEMDSYHHIIEGVKYPATLVTAGMNDPRVIAWQPGKFAAKLQAENASDNPILFLTDFDAGHGIGNTKTKQFESLSDILSFALWQTGNKKFQPEYSIQ